MFCFFLDYLFQYIYLFILWNEQILKNKMVFNQLLQYFLILLERSNLDLIYLAWLWTLFKPLCFLLLSLFLLPAIILIFMYGSSLFCLIYKHWNRLKVGKVNIYLQ